MKKKNREITNKLLNEQGFSSTSLLSHTKETVFYSLHKGGDEKISQKNYPNIIIMSQREENITKPTSRFNFLTSKVKIWGGLGITFPTTPILKIWTCLPLELFLYVCMVPLPLPLPPPSPPTITSTRCGVLIIQEVSTFTTWWQNEER